MDTSTIQINYVTEWWPLLLIGVSLLALVTTVLWVVAKLRNPSAPLAALVGATAGFQTAQVASIHVFCFAVALWLLIGALRRPRDRLRFGWPLLVVACASLLASTVLTGEMVNSKLVAIQLVLLAGTSACLIAFGSTEDVRPFLLGLLTVTSLACVAAVAQYAGVLPYKIYLGTHRPIGFYSEPDWLGMFSAVGLMIAFRNKIGWLRTPLVFLHVIVLLLAAARAAWLAVVVVAIVGYVVGKVTRRSGRTKAEPLRGGFRMAVGSIVVVLVALALSPELSDSLQSRIAGVSGGRTEVGAMARQQQNNSLLELESLAPWTGLGLSASGRVGVSGRIGYIGTSKNNIASNWLLGWWVDGGLFAIPIILLFLGAAARRVTVTSGLLLGVVLVSSLFSNATLIPISWLALAMCLMRTTPNDPDPPPELKPVAKPEPRAKPIEAAEPAALEVARAA
ncbi:MAG: hypothetical protein QOI75_4390 [Pseudonocardiales bacterium]|nr:hypothetical protein [Pseudonocardiales bacterium]